MTVSKCSLTSSNVWSFYQVCNHIQSEKYLATSVEEFCRDVDRDFSKERVCLCSGALSFTGQ